MRGCLKRSPDLVGQPGSYGSVVFRFTSFNAMNLHAAAVLSIHGEPISFQIRAHPSFDALHANGSGSLEGIWWQPRHGISDVLVMSNSSNRKVSGTLSLFDASGKRWSEALSLDPRQTLSMSTSDLVRKAGLSGSYGGIQFDAPAAVSTVDAVQFMYDEASKFSSSLEMFTRDPNATVFQRMGTDAKQFTMRAPMLPLRSPDPALNLPAQTVLQPFIFVRNTTAKVISANVALNWHSDTAKGQAKLPELQLAPFATQQVPIGTVQKQLGIPDDAHWAFVTLTTAAAPDDLIAIASSRDRSGRYGVETSFSAGFGKHLDGGELNSDANHNQIISVTNSGQEPAEAELTLHYDNGEKKYELQQTIQPDDEMWVNVSELINSRVPDRRGHTLPPNLSRGTFDVRDLRAGHSSRGNLTERSLALDQTLGARVIPQATSKCACAAEGAHWDPGDFLFLLEGGTTTDDASIMATDPCDGAAENVSGDFTIWTSSNTAVATVARQKVTKVGAGTATATAVGYILIPTGPASCGWVED